MQVTQYSHCFSTLQGFHHIIELQVYQGIKDHVNLDLVKCVLLAGPGFVKDRTDEKSCVSNISWYNRNSSRVDSSW